MNAQVIVGGYKTIYNQSGIRLRQYSDKCSLIIDATAQTFTSSWSTWVSGLVPSGCRPGNPIIVCNLYSNPNTWVCINNNGNLEKKSNSGNQNAPVWCELSWNY